MFNTVLLSGDEMALLKDLVHSLLFLALLESCVSLIPT